MRQNVKVCNKCFSEKLHLIQPTEFKVKEITQVHLASKSHQFVPYNVLLLEDSYGMLYPKKTMKSYEVGDKYDEFDVNLIYNGNVSVTCLKHKHSLYSTFLKLLSITFEKTNTTSQNSLELISKVKTLYLPIPTHLFKLTAVDRDNYIQGLKELLQVLQKHSKVSFIALEQNHKELFEKKYLKCLEFPVMLNSELKPTSKDMLLNYSPVIEGLNETLIDASSVYDSFSLKNKFTKELHINFMVSVGKLNRIQGLNSEYLDLVIGSSNNDLVSLVTSEVLCQERAFTFTSFEKLSQCEIYGENLESLKNNFFGTFKPKKHIPTEKEFKVMKNFVEEHKMGWDHQQWLDLLGSLNTTLCEEIIGSYLESIKGGEL
jgi:hypothetical protein